MTGCPEISGHMLFVRQSGEARSTALAAMAHGVKRNLAVKRGQKLAAKAAENSLQEFKKKQIVTQKKILVQTCYPLNKNGKGGC